MEDRQYRQLTASSGRLIRESCTSCIHPSSPGNLWEVYARVTHLPRSNPCTYLILGHRILAVLELISPEIWCMMCMQRSSGWTDLSMTWWVSGADLARATHQVFWGINERTNERWGCLRWPMGTSRVPPKAGVTVVTFGWSFGLLMARGETPGRCH